MSQKKIFPKEIEYRFDKLDGYKVISIDGVWGGITNQGLLRVELFSESQQLPESIKHSVIDGNVSKDEVERIPSPDSDKIIIIREIQIGTVMTLDTAKFIGDWLLKQCEAAGGS